MFASGFALFSGDFLRLLLVPGALVIPGTGVAPRGFTRWFYVVFVLVGAIACVLCTVAFVLDPGGVAPISRAFFVAALVFQLAWLLRLMTRLRSGAWARSKPAR